MKSMRAEKEALHEELLEPRKANPSACRRLLAGSKGMYGEITMTTLDVVWRQPEMAYGVMITKAVSSRVGRELSDAQVYVTLGRLEASGLVNSHLTTNSMPSVNSKGRPRKMYTLTAKGVRALEECRSASLLGVSLDQSVARSYGDEEIARKGNGFAT